MEPITARSGSCTASLYGSNSSGNGRVNTPPMIRQSIDRMIPILWRCIQSPHDGNHEQLEQISTSAQVLMRSRFGVYALRKKPHAAPHSLRQAATANPIFPARRHKKEGTLPAGKRPYTAA